MMHPKLRRLFSANSRWSQRTMDRPRWRGTRYYVAFVGTPTGSISSIVPIATRTADREGVLRCAVEEGLLDPAEVRSVYEVNEVGFAAYQDFGSLGRFRRGGSAALA